MLHENSFNGKYRNRLIKLGLSRVLVKNFQNLFSYNFYIILTYFRNCCRFEISPLKIGTEVLIKVISASVNLYNK